MPSTREIAAEFDTSRTTASAALRRLADEGLLAIRDKSTAVVLPQDAERVNVRAELFALRDDLDELRRQLDTVTGRVDALLKPGVTHE